MSPRRKLAITLAALVLVYIIGTLGFLIVEDRMGLGDAAYMTVITLSTVGFKEVGELTPLGRLWTSLVIVIGIMVVTMAFASLSAMIVSGEMRRVMGRRRLRNQISRMENHYIVCGYGRMGRHVCHDLRGHGKSVVLIELNDERTAEADEAGIQYVLGDATDEDILREAGIERAAALITVLRGDAENVFVTLTASGIRDDLPILARAEFSESARKLRRAGATHVICPMELGATRIALLLASPSVARFVDVLGATPEWEIEELRVEEGSPLAGHSLRDLKIRERCGAMVVAIRGAGGKTELSPGPERVIGASDVLVVIGPRGTSVGLAALHAGEPASTA